MTVVKVEAFVVGVISRSSISVSSTVAVVRICKSNFIRSSNGSKE